MSNSQNFETIQKLAAETSGESRIEAINATLDFLDQHFRKGKEYFQLFEVLKMKVRHRLRLSLTYGKESDQLAESDQRELEDGLLLACREVGRLLIENGQLQEGWMYLQPIGDREWIESVIRAIPVNEESLDTIIEIAISNGAAPAYGYKLLIENFGTCNAITTFDTQAMRFDQRSQQAMAEVLLRHLYAELCENLKYGLEQAGLPASRESSLAELLAAHPTLIEGGSCHIDATHLSSVMRIARLVDQPADVRIALELARYGKGLHEDFQYPNPPPFEATYPDHECYFAALLGENVDAAITYFRAKLESVDVHQFGPVAIEVLAELLVRVGRVDEALEVLTTKLLGQHEPLGVAPSVFDLADTPARKQHLKNYFREKNDLLGFAMMSLPS